MESEQIRFLVRGPRNSILQKQAIPQPSHRLASIMGMQHRIRQRIISIPNSYQIDEPQFQNHPKKHPQGKRIRSKSFMTKPTPPNQSICNPGPGHYNISDDKTSFHSKKKVVLKRTEAPSTRADEKRSTDSESTENQKEFDCYATPGPGHYQSRIMPHSSRQKKYPIKKKIQIIKLEKVSQPGPGHYEVQVQNKQRSNRFAFLNSTERMSGDSNEAPGPGTYFPRQFQIRNTTIEQNIRGYIGEFGTKDKRFKEPKNTVPDAGIYSPIFTDPSAQYSFSKGKRFSQRVSHHIPQSNIGTVKQQEQEQMPVKKAPFNVSQKRFKQKQIEKADLYHERVLREGEQRANQREPQLSAAFKGSERGEYRKEEIPFPGYGQLANRWLKKTHNICYVMTGNEKDY